jgi:group I intron endonuclease
MKREKIIGIYQIKNIINNKRYIGQSNDILKRWLKHTSDLNKNKHHCNYLQYAWNKYGEINFIFEIIEKCNYEELNGKEMYYINKFKIDKISYNSEPGGVYNNDFKKAKNKNKFTFYHIDGSIEYDITCYDLIVKYNLDSSKIYSVLSKKRNKTKGWALKPHINPLKYLFINKNNETIYLTLSELNTKTNSGNAHRLISGNMKSLKGWSLKISDEEIENNKKNNLNNENLIKEHLNTYINVNETYFLIKIKEIFNVIYNDILKLNKIPYASHISKYYVIKQTIRNKKRAFIIISKK